MLTAYYLDENNKLWHAHIDPYHLTRRWHDATQVHEGTPDVHYTLGSFTCDKVAWRKYNDDLTQTQKDALIGQAEEQYVQNKTGDNGDRTCTMI